MYAVLVAMTQSSSECIRRIRCRRSIKLQDGYDHVLYLLLGCGACANNRLLDLAGRVLEYLNVVRKGRAQRG